MAEPNSTVAGILREISRAEAAGESKERLESLRWQLTEAQGPDSPQAVIMRLLAEMKESEDTPCS